MSAVWSGSIHLGIQHVLEGITLISDDDGSHDAVLSQDVSLRYLSLVETDRVPFYLSVGRPWRLITNAKQTEAYFNNTLLPKTSTEEQQEGAASWWDHARLDSPLGILVACEGSLVCPPVTGRPRITELLFYASKSATVTRRSHPSIDERHRLDDSDLCINVLPLSSDLLRKCAGDRLTPPLSPTNNDRHVPTFLPDITSVVRDADVTHKPPCRKRKSVNDTLNEAAERRRKVRRQDSKGVAPAATLQAGPDPLSDLRHRRIASNSQSVHSASRPPSRGSSVASNGHAAISAVSGGSKPSNLSRVRSITALPDSDGVVDIEIKNKELISRTVMAGMRLYGYSQSKTRKVKAEWSSTGTKPEISESERLQDVEYKLLYHQAYKSTCFAFRNHMAQSSLLADTEALRECVDKLLAIFCSDPLLGPPESPDDKLTPGGRKLFGSAALTTSQEDSYFTGIS